MNSPNPLERHHSGIERLDEFARITRGCSKMDHTAQSFVGYCNNCRVRLSAHTTHHAIQTVQFNSSDATLLFTRPPTPYPNHAAGHFAKTIAPEPTIHAFGEVDGRMIR